MDDVVYARNKARKCNRSAVRIVQAELNQKYIIIRNEKYDCEVLDTAEEVG